MQSKRVGTFKTLFLGIILGIIVTFASPVSATGDAVVAIQNLIAFMKPFFNSLVNDTVSDLTKSNSKESGRVSTAVGASTDSRNKLNVDLYNAEISFLSKQQTNTCESNDIAHDIQQSEKIKIATIPLLGKPILKSNISTTNVTAHIERIFKTHESNFCGDQDPDCDKKTYANADLSAWNLLKPGGYSDKEMLAAYNYLAISTNPRPTPALPLAAANSVQGKEARMVLMEETTHMTAAQNSILHIIADRTPIKGLGKSVGLSNAAPVDLRIHEINRRYGNPVWVDEISSDSFVPAIKEMALMMSLQLYQNERVDRRFERIEILLQTLVSIETKRASKEDMKTIRERATESING